MRAFDLRDNHLISKTFEKGANACLTEESCFAVLTNSLSTTRTLSTVISDQMSSGIVNPEDIDADSKPSLPSEETKKDPSAVEVFANKIGQNFAPGGDKAGGILNSECIPCGVRIKFPTELDVKKIASDFSKQMAAAMRAWLTRALAQIKQIIDMFSNFDKYNIDLCSLLKFLNDFICIPDLTAMIAALMALLMDVSFELNGIIDGILSLIMPLFAPFLINLMDVLQAYILMVLKPIECIIDSIQNMLGKLDYNVMFKNLEKLDVSLGPKVGKPSVSVSLPILGALIPSAEVQNPAFPDNRKRSLEFNLAPAQKSEYLKQQAEVDQAAKEMEALRKASSSVDASDPAAYKKYKDQETAAKQNYKDKVQNRDLSQIGQLNKNIEEFQMAIKSAFLQLIFFLREVCLKFDAFIASLFDEIKKLLGEYAGGSGLFINFAAKKLAILQIIGFITAVIAAIKRGGLNCDTEEKQIEAFTAILSKEQSLKIETDAEGNIHILEDATGISNAIDALEKARSKPNIAGQTPVQRINSLVELTGDPIIDLDIIQSIDKFATGNKTTLRCSKQVTKEGAEQINSWIEEIKNAE
jgi:hypothetical protein